MKKIIAILLAFMTCFLVACGGDSSKGSANVPTDDGPSISENISESEEFAGVLKIGLCVPITGSMAMSGEYSRMGTSLAIEQINSAGGVKVGNNNYKLELVIQDNEGKPDVTINAYNKLIGDDKVIAIVGTNASGTSMAAGPIATEAKVPAIATTASNPDVTLVGGEYVFRTCWIDDYQGKVCAIMAQEVLGAKKVAILYNNSDDYSTGVKDVFEKEFKALGGEVSSEAYAGADVKDFKAQLTSIQNYDPDVIFIPVQGAEVPLPVQQIREMGLDVQIMGEMSWDTDIIPELAGAEAIEGCYFLSMFAVDGTEPLTVEYVKDFKEKYEIVPNNQSTMSYNAVQVIAQALRDCGVVDDKEAFRDAIASVNMELPSGNFYFDENRNPQLSANVMMYVDGKSQYVKTIK